MTGGLVWRAGSRRGRWCLVVRVALADGDTNLRGHILFV
jgi:hypothetical protein